MDDPLNAEPPKRSTHFGRKSSFRAEHPWKAVRQTSFRDEPREIPIEDKFLQSWKAELSITLTVLGSESFSKDVHEAKAYAEIFLSVEPFSNSKRRRLEQLEKQPNPILVVILGRVNDFNDEHLSNAFMPNVSEDRRGRKLT
jgi:hypothetical protein